MGNNDLESRLTLKERVFLWVLDRMRPTLLGAVMKIERAERRRMEVFQRALQETAGQQGSLLFAGLQEAIEEHLEEQERMVVRRKEQMH